MKTIKKILLTWILTIFGVWICSLFNYAPAQSIYDDVLWRSVSNKETGWSLSSAIRWEEVVTWEKWSELFNKQVLAIIGYIIDIFIVVWIVVAFIGGYKIMTSSKEDSLKDGIRLVIYGIIWIVIMVSARFLAEGLVWNDGVISREFANPDDTKNPNWVNFATALYEKILYPFIKFILYLVIWVLFFMMAAKVVSYVTATDDSVKKKAWWVIIRSVIGILIVMWAKQLVESVMWKQNIVLNESATRINEQTPGSVLNFGRIPIVTQIINWVMWLTMLVILVLIIIQGYKMFTKPDDPKNRESLKKTLLYIIIWVLVIGAAYAISNALVINNIPITE